MSFKPPVITETHKTDFQNALLRAREIASRMSANIKNELLMERIPKTEEQLNTLPKINPYGSGAGQPRAKGDMVIPFSMCETIASDVLLKRVGIECNVILHFVAGAGHGDDGGVKIEGTEIDIAYAKATLFKEMSGTDAPHAMFAPKETSGPQTVFVKVSADRVGLVIGKGGENIKLLQEQTGARINVLQEGESDNSDRTIQVAGSVQAISYARQLIADIVNPAGQQQMSGRPAGAVVTEHISVPNDKVGLVIGKGGEVIKLIQKDCNVKLTIDTTPNDEGERSMQITGTQEDIELAKEAVWERVAGRRGRVGYSDGEGYGYSYQQAPAAQQQYVPAAQGQYAQSGQQQYAEATQMFTDENGKTYDYNSKEYAEYYAKYYASQGYAQEFQQ